MSVVLLAEIEGKPRAIARIDVNGGRHESRDRICGDLQHDDAGTTHFHDTRLHRDIAIGELFSGRLGDLPIARPISDIPDDLSEVMEKNVVNCCILKTWGRSKNRNSNPSSFLFDAGQQWRSLYRLGWSCALDGIQHVRSGTIQSRDSGCDGQRQCVYGDGLAGRWR